MPYFTDQAGRSVEIKSPATKIISLVPSQTELLFDLGLDESVIGITKFCIHPDHWFRTKQRVGGTKNPNLQLIYGLQPDLIIGNKEENRKEDIESLAENFPVWLSDINNLDDALQMIDVISRITATTNKGQQIINNIRDNFKLLRFSIQSRSSKESSSSKLSYFSEQSDSSEPPGTSNELHTEEQNKRSEQSIQRFKVCYLIWQDPYIAVGNNTFIHSMMLECGLENVFAFESRYPTITAEAITAKDCDFILLSTEPYPFTEKHVVEIKSLFPDSVVLLVDGELFSWYGTRLIRSASYFQTLINKLQDAAGTD